MGGMIQTQFTSWQTGGFHPSQFPTDSPNLVELRSYVMDRWGGWDLGCRVVRRLSSGAWSTHSFGAAIDWRWQHAAGAPAGTRFLTRPAAESVLEWAISNSKALGLQAIHDYYGDGRGNGRIWRPPGTSGRPIGSDGWRIQRRSGAMGASWAGWFHLETHPAMWHDARPVADRLRPPPPPPDNTPPPPLIERDLAVRPYPFSDARLLDTRIRGDRVPAGGTVTVKVPQRIPCSAVMVNVTVVDPESAGYLTAWGSGPRPNTSLQNHSAGMTVAGVTMIPVGADGNIRIYSHASGHLLVDLVAVGA